MATVQELEKQLQEAKRKELYENWEAYLDKSKAFLQTLVNRTFIRHYRNNCFVMFKVTGFKEQYYGNVEGMDGSWTPRRWLELTTSGYMNVCEPSYYLGGSIETMGYGTHEFVKVNTKGYKKGTVEISKIEFVNREVGKSGLADINNVVRFGFKEYEEKEYKDRPEYDRAMTDFTMFAHEVPVQLYDEAKAIRDEMVQKTVDYWEKHKTTINTAPRIVK